jgi:hypothetical protein
MSESMGGRLTPVLLFAENPFVPFPLPDVFVEPPWVLPLLLWEIEGSGPGDECEERIAGRVSPLILPSIIIRCL